YGTSRLGALLPRRKGFQEGAAGLPPRLVASSPPRRHHLLVAWAPGHLVAWAPFRLGTSSRCRPPGSAPGLACRARMAHDAALLCGRESSRQFAMSVDENEKKNGATNGAASGAGIFSDAGSHRADRGADHAPPEEAPPEEHPIPLTDAPAPVAELCAACMRF